jgi:hypothetical protein
LYFFKVRRAFIDFSWCFVLRQGLAPHKRVKCMSSPFFPPRAKWPLISVRAENRKRSRRENKKIVKGKREKRKPQIQKKIANIRFIVKSQIRGKMESCKRCDALN